MPEDTFVQSFIIHVVAKPVRTSTEVISVTAGFHSVHVVTLLADDVPQRSHRAADNTNKALFVGPVWHKDRKSWRYRHGCTSCFATSVKLVLSSRCQERLFAAAGAVLLGGAPSNQRLRRSFSECALPQPDS